MFKNILVVIFFIFSIESFAQLSGYAYFKKFTTQESQITSGSNDLLNYPVLIRFTDADLRTTGFGGYLTNANGYDIQFTSADKTTLIPFQLEKYDQTTGELVVWVQVPVVSATVNTDFYLFFGNSLIVSNPSTASTWDANYKGVWHLNNDFTDATINGFDLTDNGSNIETPSLIADGKSVNAGDYFSRPITTGLQINNDVTLETWVNFSNFLTTRDDNVLFSSGFLVSGLAINNYNYLFSVMGDAGNLYKLRLYWQNGLGTVNEAISSVALPAILTGWHHLVAMRNTTLNKVDFYVDGQKLGASIPITSPATGGTNTSFNIGKDQSLSGNDLDAKLDEPRVSNVVRAPEWIEATYEMAKVGANFILASTSSCNVTPPNSGTDQTICLNNTTLAANEATIGVGTWSLITGSATIDVPTSYSTTISNISSNSASFVWSISNGSCTIDGNRIIIYTDSVVPSISCIASQTVNALAGCSYTLADYTASVTATDNCGTVTVVQSPVAGTVVGLGDHAVSLTATDAIGLNSVCNFTVTVADNTPPTIMGCPASRTVNVSAGLCTRTQTWAAPTVSDNCPGAVVGLSTGSVSGTAFPKGVTVITYTATDATGLTSSCSFSITVRDNIAPTIVGCPASRTVNVSPGLCTGTATWTAPSVNDNCPGATIGLSTSSVSGSAFPKGVTVVTYTAIDAVGLTATCNFSVTVRDNIPPSILGCPGSVTVNVTPGLCTGTTTWVAPTVSDNCGGATIALTTGSVSGSAFPTGNTVITYLATDAASLTTACVFTVTVIDNSAPTIVGCPASRTVNVSPGLCTGTTTWVAPTVTDNCTGATIGISTGSVSGSAFPKGITVVTYTATDASGLTAIPCTFTVTVIDNIAPTIVGCPASRTVNVTAGLCTGISTWAAPTVNDNCTGATIGISTGSVSGSAFPKGVTVVTYTATDAVGLTASCSFSVTVKDNIAPTIVSCPASRTVNVTAGLCTGTATWNTPSVTDNCPGASIGLSTGLVSGSAFPKGVTVVTYTAVDAAGLTATCNFSVTVKDNISPTIVGCPSSFTVNNTIGFCSGIVNWTSPTVTDNCAGASINQTGGNSSGSFFPIGNTVVTYTASDAAGLSASCVFTVTVKDNSPPSIVSPTNVVAATNPGVCTNSTVVLGNPVTFDNCAVTSVTNNKPSAFPLGITIVTWTVTDNSGLTATSTQTVTIVDNIAPTITAPPSVTVATNAGCANTLVALGTPTTGDNCSVVSVVNNAPATYTLGSTVVTWTVTDGAGLKATKTQTVTVVDNTLPTITSPLNVTVTTNFGCTNTLVAIGTPTTSDNCSVASVVNNAPLTYPLGMTIVTWTVKDGSGNVNTATQTITVNDNSNPTIVAPSSLTVATNVGACTNTMVALGTPTTGDNCSVASITNNAPATYSLGTTIVTWTVTDGSGNTTSATQTVTVADNINPTIVAPADVTVTTNVNCTNTLVALGTPTTGDNCSVANVTNNAPATYTLGTTVVTWTVTDGSGNKATATQTVTVSDNSNPTITAPPNVTVATNAACTNTLVALGTPTVSDNCSVVSVVNDAPATYTLGTTVVTWTVTDGSGLMVVATQTVTIIDNTAPTILSPANQTVNVDAGQCSNSAVVIGTPTTSDNCSVASVVNNAPTIYPLGNTIVTWTVTDGAGLTATSSQTITVKDNVFPTITAPSNVTLTTNVGCTNTLIALGTPTLNDNCSIAGFANNAPSVYPLGNTIVTWTVTDGSGNKTTSTQTVTVIDVIPPSILSVTNLTLTTDVGQCSHTTTNIGVPVTSDNCSVVSLLNDAPATFSLGTTVVTWTVIDGAGLSATGTQTITVVDNILPQIVCGQNVTVVANSSSCSATGVVLINPTATDNCSVFSVNNNAPVIYPAGNTTVIWTVTDGSGLMATCSQTVLVTDTVKPAISVPASVVVYNSLTNCGAIVNNIAPVSFSDNCMVSGINYAITGATNGSGNNDASGVNFNFGLSYVTYQVKDVQGNIDTASFSVEVKNTIPLSNAGVNQIICENQMPVSLNANQAPAGMLGKWSVISGQGTYSNVNLETSTVTNLQYGINTLRWTVYSSPCDSAYSDVLISVDQLPSNVFAGTNDTICENQTSYQLNANSIINGSAVWSQINGTSTILSAANPTTIIQNLSNGLNRYVWTASNGVCLFKSDTVDVMVDQLPSTAFAGNDLLLPIPIASLNAATPIIGQGMWQLITGSGTIDAVNNPLATITNLQLGVNVFNWVVTNGVCPSSIDDIKIEFSGLFVPNAISPNGDGINDSFEILGLEYFKDVKLQIFNRWGNLVYENSDYKNDFSGNNTQNQPLVDDTYFYFIEISDKIKYNNYLIIKREK